MKRYECELDWEHDKDDPIVFRESPDGEWVCAEDAEAEIAKLRAVVDALPRCDECNRPAMQAYANTDEDVSWKCDACRYLKVYELPYAAALRALEGK